MYLKRSTIARGSNCSIHHIFWDICKKVQTQKFTILDFCGPHFHGLNCSSSLEVHNGYETKFAALIHRGSWELCELYELLDVPTNFTHAFQVPWTQSVFFFFFLFRWAHNSWSEPLILFIMSKKPWGQLSGLNPSLMFRYLRKGLDPKIFHFGFLWAPVSWSEPSFSLEC